MKKALLFILLSVAAAGCHKSDIVGPAEPQGDPVAVDFALSGLRAGVVPASRAEETEELAVGTTVRVLVFQRANSASPANIASDKFFAQATYVVKEIDGVRSLVPCNVDGITGEEDAANAAAPAEIRLRAAEYDFYAFTPATAIAAPWQVTVDYGVDHASSLTEKVAVGPSHVNAATRKQSVTLSTLQRRCSQLSFAIERKSENVNKITIKSATLSRIPSGDVTQTLCQPFPLRTGTSGDFTFPTGIFSSVDDKDYKLSGKEEVLPKGETSFDLSMTINFNDSNIDKEVSATVPAMKFEPNVQYCFVITLKGGSFSLTLYIMPWDAEYSSDLIIGDFHYGSVDLGSWSFKDLDFELGA